MGYARVSTAGQDLTAQRQALTALGVDPKRIRCAKDTGLTNLPLFDFDQNRIWCAVVALACELTAWLGMLALAGHQGRRWEPKRLRLRLFSVARRLAVSGRRVVLHLSRAGDWSQLALSMLRRLRTLPAPAG